MHLTKYTQEQVQNSYMFRQRGAIIRKLFRTKEHKPNTPA
jgi:hypothetical protein